eukprot:TRINITY_DN864_c0_g1_i1.p1 TRINITY_DN864_c0_g1~~TRINITY_DN864_c0_g1_i1.p1  ORF type:complete len:583 (-),score=194.40 TRINITY_DN864_c0_g1_i1:964-2712(-)
MNFLKAATSLFGDEEEAEEKLLPGSSTGGTIPMANSIVADTKENKKVDDVREKSLDVDKESSVTGRELEIEVENAETTEKDKGREDAIVEEEPPQQVLPTALMANDPPATSEPIKATDSMSAWSWGGILKTLAEKSEEVLQDYRRDLQEFTAGLKEETVAVVDKTKHVVHDLPQSLETSVETAAHSAQESLDIVGHSIEDFGASVWRGTTEIIAQVKEAVALVEEEAAMNAKQLRSNSNSSYASAALTRGKYSRYEAQVSAMQRDSGTYCDEPEDTEDFATWNSTFKLDDRKADIEAILKENAFMQELQSRIVPMIVEYDTFWTRYFYRLHKLQLAEDARADLVKRANTEEEEELSWDVDDAEAEETKSASVMSGDEKEAPGGEVSRAKGEAKEDLLPAGAEFESAAPVAVAKPDIPAPIKEASGPTTPSPKDAPTPPEEIAPAPSPIDPAPVTTTRAPPEEDAGSDGSATSGGTSEWLVVQKEDSPKGENASASAAVEGKAKEVKAAPAGKATKGKAGGRTISASAAEPEPELDTSKDEIASQKNTGSDKSSESVQKKGSKEDKRPAKSDDAVEEDWGEWE